MAVRGAHLPCKHFHASGTAPRPLLALFAGNQNWAYRYVIKEGGLCTEADYPYTGQDGKCKASTCGPKHSPIHNFAWPQHRNITVMKATLLQQPVSIGVNAGDNWQFYGGGVLKDSCTGGIDHAVLATGWINVHGQSAWAVRNSWTAGWGEQGYIWLDMNYNLPNGVSCILDQPIIPLVSGPIRHDDSPAHDYDDPWNTTSPSTGAPSDSSTSARVL